MAQPKGIAWQPHPGPQSFAFYDCEDVDELLFGGARSGGKTSYVLGDNLARVGEFSKLHSSVIFRKSYPQLDEIISQGRQMYCETGLATFNKADCNFNFKNGATTRLRHIESLADCEKYQGHQFTAIYFDECTGFKDFRIFERMKACARNPYRNIKSVIRYTGNPGGHLHNEIKQYFVDPTPLGYKLIVGDSGKNRMYVPSKITDNATMMENDPDYHRYLQSITDPELRRAWLDGSWDVALGSFFGDVFNRNIHVVKSMTTGEIPSHWNRYRAFDWGSAKPYCNLWYTVARDDIEIHGRYFPNGAIIIYRELYGCQPGRFDVGLYQTSTETARKIKATEATHGETHIMRPGPADNAIWNKIDGPSIGEMMAAEGIYYDKGDKTRDVGWEQVRIRFKGYDSPLLYITEDCVNTIRTLPTLPRDEKKFNDIETHSEDHAADVVRYICMKYQVKPLPINLAHLYGKERDPDQGEVLDPKYG